MTDRLPYTAEDGPQATAAEAYAHAADMLTALAEKARRQAIPQTRAWVQVEYIEHLAEGLAARAEEARHWSGR